MIIAIDFDGTLFQNTYPSVGEVMPGAVSAMQTLRQRGHYLIIWTCRYGEYLTDAVNALLEHGIPFDRINDHNPENIRQYGGEAGKKVYAHLYIDDKNLGGFPGWEVALKEISRVEEEYESLHKGLRTPVE
ncbi:hypothetical protein CBG53_03125 [Porphyromonas gingivalis]|uniref:hypothetical protein n=1 Tax=Porphyromonas gingivalis TaxID=837 RepID=UPI000B4D620F|nr:hypothetical protein [Porphyromonas gingivalis]MCE8190758.1 hypothetical protein [Porphyromonas gingivalis]OWP32465.1 hypothetical protein CBG53_03125 [Porphyromonas gingivalis]